MAAVPVGGRAYWNVAGGSGFFQSHTSGAYTGVFPTNITLDTLDIDGNLCIYCDYTPTTTPNEPSDTYMSGYLTRYQKRQIVGYCRDSGDLRSIEVNASGAIKTDVEVVVSSGLIVAISGQHVYVESGAYVVTTVGSGLFVDGVSGVHVFIESGAYVVTTVGSGLFVDGVSGAHVYQESGAFVTAEIAGGITITSGVFTAQSGLHVWISGQHVYVESGVHVVSLSGTLHTVVDNEIAIGTPTSILTNATTNPLMLSDNSGGEILTSGEIKSLIVKALAKNSGDIYVGGYETGHMPYSGAGMLVAPGEAISLDICQIGYVHACGTVSGYDYVTYIGVEV